MQLKWIIDVKLCTVIAKLTFFSIRLGYWRMWTDVVIGIETLFYRKPDHHLFGAGYTARSDSMSRHTFANWNKLVKVSPQLFQIHADKFVYSHGHLDQEQISNRALKDLTLMQFFSFSKLMQNMVLEVGEGNLQFLWARGSKGGWGVGCK